MSAEKSATFIGKKNGEAKSGGKRNVRQYIMIYTCLFAVVCALVFCWYYLAGRTLIWETDGWRQHYKAMIYWAQYLREFAENLIFHHQFILPEWDFALGEGTDVLQALNYYVIGDPFALFCIFVPTRYMWIYYSFMVLLRLYLAGLAFSWLCFYTKKNCSRYAVLVGAVIYAFCFWGLWNANRHPYFLNPMVYFPLIILGVEKILKKEKPYILIVSVFLASISNFYFFYILAVLTVIYVLIRLILIYKKDIRNIFMTLLRIGLPAILGTLMGAVIVLPVLIFFLNDTRMDSSSTWSLFYPLSYYSGLPGSFYAGESGYWALMGYSAPVLLAVFFLFMQKRKHTLLKICFIVGGIVLLCPVFGRVLNGMSYVANRWIWGLALLCAYTFTVLWSDMMNIKFRQAIRLACCLAVYTVLCLFLDYSREISAFVSICVAFLFLFAILPFSFEDQKSAKVWQRRKRMAAFCLSIAGVLCVSFFINAPTERNYAAQAVEAKDIETELKANETAAVKKAAERDGTTEFYRYSGRKLTKNAGTIAGLSGTNYGWSISNAAVAEYMREMETPEILPMTHSGYDDRASLMAQSSVLYFTVPFSDESPAPYGFTYVDAFDTGGTAGAYKVYRNETPLPLGYTYDGVIAAEDWESLSALEKQEAMLEAAYLENYDGGMPAEEITPDTRSVDYTVECNDKGVTVDDHAFTVTKKNASVTLHFTGLADSETYLRVQGLNFEGVPQYDLYFGDDRYDPLDLYTKERWDQFSYEQKQSAKRNALFWQDPDMVSLGLQASTGVSEKFYYYTEEYTWYNDRHDFSVNLDYSEEAASSITITFSDIGVYSFDSLEVLCQPLSDYEDQVAALNEQVLENVNIADDVVTGDITVDRPSVLCLAIPYSSGWTAYVDGEETELYKANIKYMAVELGEGAHSIRLEYRCPFLRAGAVISVLAFAGFIALLIIDRRRGKAGSMKKKETSGDTKATEYHRKK